MNDTNEKEVIFTGSIPQCPKCNKPTKRSPVGGSTTTCMYFTPVYNEEGINTNPDRNTTTSSYQCLECRDVFTTKGNRVNGYKYI